MEANTEPAVARSQGFTQSYRPAGTAESLVDVTIGDLLRQAAAECPEQVYLIDGCHDPAMRRRLTFAQVLDQALACGEFLAARFAKGDHVAIWAANSIEWAIVEFGAAFAGVVLVTMNPAYRASEAEYVLRQSRAVGIILDRSYRDVDMAGIISELAPRLPLLRDVIFLDALDEMAKRSARAPLPAVDAHDEIMIQYTSGTTGQPKGAVLVHHGVVNSSRLTVGRLALPPHGVWLLPLPMFHTGGSVYSVLGTLWSRSALVIMRDFDAGLLLNLVEQEKVQYYQAVPTMHLRVLDHPERSATDLSSMLGIGSGGTTVPEDLVRRMEAEYGCEYFMIFGQTETSSVVCHTVRGDTDYHKASTIGVPLDHIEMKVIDPGSGEITPIGVTGEICIRGFGVLKEYFDMPEASAATIGRDGWMRTGDLGVMLEDGYFQIVGRLKDMIIRGGENIFPREIEDVLVTHPAILDAAVFGVPDPHWGEELAVAVRIADGHSADQEEFRAFLREHVARHKVPRIWHVIDQFPLTPSGKIQKFVLRERYGGKS